MTPTSKPLGERRDGHSKLVYDKETRTIVASDPHPPLGDGAADGFTIDDFADVWEQLNSAPSDAHFMAVLSNCHNVILAALKRSAQPSSNPLGEADERIAQIIRQNLTIENYGLSLDGIDDAAREIAALPPIALSESAVVQIAEMIRTGYDPKPSNDGYPAQYDDLDDGAESIAQKIAALYQPAGDEVEAAARALKACAETFERPVHFYVEPEARNRWEKDNPDGDAWAADIDFEMESWRILARAALASRKPAAEREGAEPIASAIAEIEAKLPPTAINLVKGYDGKDQPGWCCTLYGDDGEIGRRAGKPKLAATPQQALLDALAAALLSNSGDRT